MIKGLHHSAFRCRDSEETRAFYEDFLGLPLVNSLHIEQTKTGRGTDVMHTFYRMADGSCLAFFEVPGVSFDFKPQHDFDLHIALEVEADELRRVQDKAAAAGLENRGLADHDFIESLYLRDPNGYVVELTAKRPGHEQAMDPRLNKARDVLDAWQRRKLRGKTAAV
jgi:catechol 2,3-dioxygenase-like lactoylglutathione lyase family enzyme